MRVFRRGVPAVLVILLSVLFLKGSTINVPTGTWQSTANMSAARANAVAVLVPDGRIVIAGGTDAAGTPTASAEAFSADGSFSALPAMSAARSRHAAIYTMTGDLLVTGGYTSGGGVTNSAEIFDSLTNTWHSLSATMLDARAGHTMSQLQNGNVLIAGGENSSGPVAALELYDITSGQFSFAGTLASARKGHAAAVLNDGRVLIIGGTTVQSDGTSATLASTEIYDPSTGQVIAGPSLATPRTDATATTLLDGRVLVLGGSYPEGANGAAPELASAEIYDPVSNTFTASASHLTTARTGHLAFLLPNNNNVLITGGTSTQPDGTVSPLASAELYTPWTDTFAATSPMSTARSSASGSALGNGTYIGLDGMLLLAGGTNQNSAEAYGFATVKTDSGDYAPGQTVVITGSGWQPGETVKLTLVEVPNIDAPPEMTAVADVNGNIYSADFVTDIYDLNVRFYLTAKGSKSQALNTFTDGTPQIDSVSVDPISPNQPTSAGVNDSTVISASNQGGSGPGTINDFRIRIHSGSAAGALVREFKFTNVNKGDTVSATWDGKDSANAFVADGIYVVLASNSTNETTTPASKTGTVVVDSTNPTITLSAPADSAYVRGSNVSLVAAPSDAGGDDSNIAKVEFYIDGSLVGSDTNSSGGWSFALNTGTLTDGDHLWSSKAYDKAGNNASSVSRTLKVDNASPSVTIGSVTGNAVNTPVTITGTSSDLPVFPGYGTAFIQITISGAGTNTGTATNTGTNFSTWSYTFTPTVGGSYAVVAKATDQAGNFANSTAQTFNVIADNTSPVITPNVTGTLGSDGWYTSDVTVSWSVTDPESTITSQTGCGSTTINTDTTGTTLTCSATSAGGTSSQSVTIKRDATAPVITFLNRTAANGNGWNNSAVTLNWSCSDVTSGPATTSVSATVSDEGQNQSSTGTCHDNAGNSATNTQNSINIDKTQPTLTFGAQTPTANVDGWNKTDVSFAFTPADNLSGVDTTTPSISPLVITNEGSGLTGTVTVTDKAGNSATFTSPAVNIDKTAPILTGSRIPAANANGWNNTDVTAQFSCSDSLSGAADKTADTIVSTEGTNQSVNGTCSDKAGNTASGTVSDISIDKTAPSASSSAAPAANGNGWNNSDVTVTFTGNDTLSGIDFCTPAKVLTSEGENQSASGTCTDKAGNVSSSTTASGINIDKTAPTLTFDVPSPAANDAGWNSTDVNFAFTYGDSLSGVDTASHASPLVLTAEGASVTGSVTVTDKAGNSKTFTTTAIKIDKTAPTISSTRTAPNGNGWNNTDVTVQFDCSDSLSGLAAGSPPASSTLSTEGENLSVTGTCYDTAGNSASTSATGINIDKTPPTAAATPSPAANSNGWNNTDVTVTFAGNDALSGIASCTAPAVLNTEGQGLSASGSCLDKAGNTSAVASANGINIDKTAPALAPSVNPNPAILHGTATANANASDSLSGVVSQSCATPDLSTVGVKSLSCTATDKAGNTSNGSASYSVQFLSGGVCYGDYGHQILQPINVGGTSVFKRGSVVPMKFRVCDANGQSIGPDGATPNLWVGTSSGTITDVNESIYSNTPDTSFRWDPTAQQWIFNFSTKGTNPSAATYWFQVQLNDGSNIPYHFGLR